MAPLLRRLRVRPWAMIVAQRRGFVKTCFAALTSVSRSVRLTPAPARR